MTLLFKSRLIKTNETESQLKNFYNRKFFGRRWASEKIQKSSLVIEGHNRSIIRIVDFLRKNAPLLPSGEEQFKFIFRTQD